MSIASSMCVGYKMFIQEVVQCKAHRKKQGDGVVPCAEPLLRSNAAMRRLLNEHGVLNVYGI